MSGRGETTARTGWNDPEPAERYDREMAVVFGPPMAEGMLRAVPLEGARLVLDIAAGTGFFSAFALERLRPEARVIGCDPGRAVLQVAARKGLDRLLLVETDGHRLPFPDAAFDRVYCNLAMQIVLEPDRVAAEMARVLRPGGGLAYAAPGRGTAREFWEAFTEVVRRPDRWALLDDAARERLRQKAEPDDEAESAPHRARPAAARLERVSVHHETVVLTFDDAAELYRRGAYGHMNEAVELFGERTAELRAELLGETARLLDASLQGGRLELTVRPLVAAGWKVS
ncbi:MAG: class I SAM-dependent methyltransferase [Chloroflexi bacterium]|nr:class I SAM-dependent methyltransferase [Chloroflexota bacterium]